MENAKKRTSAGKVEKEAIDRSTLSLPVSVRTALDQHYQRETEGLKNRPSFSKWLGEQILELVESKDRELDADGSGPVESADLESIHEAAARGAATGVIQGLGDFALKSGGIIVESLTALERRIADMERAVSFAVDSIEREFVPSDDEIEGGSR